MDAQRGIARRMVIGLPEGGLPAEWERDFSAYPPAGVIVFGRDFADLDALRRLTTHLRALARPRRIFIGIDEEGGFVSQLAPHLTVPPNAALLARGAAEGDIEWAAAVTGRRLRALGVDWVFAPVADVNTRPENPVIGPRAFGSDPAFVSRAVKEALRGYHSAGIATCIKHFPGHGDTELDSHIALPRTQSPLATLERRELLPFRENLDADAVMSAHVVFDALDPDRPGTFSPKVAGDLLRGTLGFQGVSITDALEMKGASSARTPAEVGRLALEAGCDLLLYAFHHEDVRRARLTLARQLADGEIERGRFDAARPRLAAFDARNAEPSEVELTRAVDALTPGDWEARLEAIVGRGLELRGTLPDRPGAWRVTEPTYRHGGPTLRDELRRAGAPVADDATNAVLDIVAISSRKPLPAEEVDRLRALGRAGPLALIGMQNDAFLDLVPEAALRVSAADEGALTRRVLARRLTALPAQRLR